MRGIASLLTVAVMLAVVAALAGCGGGGGGTPPPDEFGPVKFYLIVDKDAGLFAPVDLAADGIHAHNNYAVAPDGVDVATLDTTVYRVVIVDLENIIDQGEPPHQNWFKVAGASDKGDVTVTITRIADGANCSCTFAAVD